MIEVLVHTHSAKLIYRGALMVTKKKVVVSHSLFVIFGHFKNDAIEQSKLAIYTNKNISLLIEPAFRQCWRGIENAGPLFGQHNYLCDLLSIRL